MQELSLIAYSQVESMAFPLILRFPRSAPRFRNICSLVTCNGPFVDLPSLSSPSGLNGQVILEMPQSATVFLNLNAIVCVRGSLSGLLSRKLSSHGIAFSKVLLTSSSTLITQDSRQMSHPIRIINATKSEIWVINRAAVVCAWSDLRFSHYYIKNYWTIRDSGFFALRLSKTTLQLQKGQTIYVHRDSFVATNAKIVEAEWGKSNLVTKISYSSLRSASFYSIFRLLIWILGDFLRIRKQSKVLLYKETIFQLHQIEISGPGTVILS